MASDDDGQDISNLKSRLGLSDEDEEDDGEESEQQDQPQQSRGPGAQQGGPQSSGGGAPGPSQGGGPGAGGGSQGPPGGGGSSRGSGSPSGAGGNQPGGNQAGGNQPGGNQPGGGGPPSAGGPPGGGGPAQGGGPGAGPGQSGGPPGGTSPSGGEDDFAGPTREMDREETVGAEADAGFDEEDVELDEDIDFGEDETFTWPVIGLIAGTGIVGLVFGLVLQASMNTRAEYQNRTRQAQKVVDELGPKVERFNKVQELVGKLDTDEVQYDVVKELGSLADKGLEVSTSAIGTDRLVLGQQRTSMLTSYMVQAQRLQKRLKEHDRLTNQSDKKKLEEIQKKAGGGGEGDEDVQFAAVFNFNWFKRNVGSEDYSPKTGKLVQVQNLDEPEEGKVKYKLPNSDRTGEVDIRGVVPLNRGDVLTFGGQNAFQRYQRRVEELKLLVKNMEGQPKSLMQKMKELANRSSPPLVKL